MMPKHWSKQAAMMGGNVIRLACLPPGQTTTPATFAVRQPGDMTPARSRKRDDWMELRAGAMTVRWREDGRRLSKKNLEVAWKQDGRQRMWRPGDIDRENLGGPYQALDLLAEALIGGEKSRQPYNPMKGYNSCSVGFGIFYDIVRLAVEPRLPKGVDRSAWGEDLWRLLEGRPPKHLKRWPESVLAAVKRVARRPPGLLSRAGLSVVRDDSQPWDEAANWILPRPKVEPQILYFVHYGRDFKAGVRGLRNLFGPPPALPDWALGVWYSCYQVMGERHFRKIAVEFEKRDLPLDAVVVDTDWHREFWHGFDWNRKLFPDPGRFRDWLEKRGLHTAFNVHPNFIPANDDRLEEFLERGGAEKKILGPDEAPHPFMEGCQRVDLFDQRQAEAYYDVFHQPIEEEGGCDVWWVDGTLGDNKRQDATAFMNECYAVRGRFDRSAGVPPAKSSVSLKQSQKKNKTTANEQAGRLRYGRTRFVLSRGHGLGAHRSLLHFTGDTLSQWAVLREEVRLTPLAANSLVAYTSHDIGGFQKGAFDWKENKPPVDLMVRWLQFGVFSPIMRLHSDHGVREPWKFGRRAGEIMARFLRLRRALLPYLRQCADEAVKTGLALARPMYYEFPEHEEAYQFPLQYMLGPDLLVAPVTNADGEAEYWLPPGGWVHLFDGTDVPVSAIAFENTPLEFIPVYIRAGSKWSGQFE